VFYFGFFFFFFGGVKESLSSKKVDGKAVECRHREPQTVFVDIDV